MRGCRPGRQRDERTGVLVGAALVVASGVLVAVGCRPASQGETGPPSASDPPPALDAGAARSSLAPLYALVPREEYGRLAPPVGGTPAPLLDADFVSPDVRISAATRLGEIAEQIAAERGRDVPQEIVSADDRARAQGIPFRGNPSDVVLADLPGDAKLFVPLGGDLMTPGNEVAVVGVERAPAMRARIRVGVRPQRLAVHPAGLVFVCNQYSNYLSIIHAAREELLVVDGRALEIATLHSCSDLAFAPVDPAASDSDAQLLYVANRQRRSVLEYRVEVVRDAADEIVDVRQVGLAGSPPGVPLREFSDVGPSPTRLHVHAPSRSLYVTNQRGGAVARIDLDAGVVVARFDAGAPAIDLARIGDRVYVPTLMPDRGLLSSDEAADVSPLVQAAPFEVTGLDGQTHVAHPGARFDGTRSYNFEDVRNGLYALDADLLGALVYYTDDVSAEPNFGPAQKILAGALPQAIVRNRTGDRMYVALGGSDLVQELIVDPAAPEVLTAGRSFSTRERPSALALDEERAESAASTTRPGPTMGARRAPTATSTSW
jgi:DNA-binding beta-propeller fold protein YncE